MNILLFGSIPCSECGEEVHFRNLAAAVAASLFGIACDNCRETKWEEINEKYKDKEEA